MFKGELAHLAAVSEVTGSSVNTKYEKLTLAHDG